LMRRCVVQHVFGRPSSAPSGASFVGVLTTRRHGESRDAGPWYREWGWGSLLKAGYHRGVRAVQHWLGGRRRAGRRRPRRGADSLGDGAKAGVRVRVVSSRGQPVSSCSRTGRGLTARLSMGAPPRGGTPRGGGPSECGFALGGGGGAHGGKRGKPGGDGGKGGKRCDGGKGGKRCGDGMRGKPGGDGGKGVVCRRKARRFCAHVVHLVMVK